MKSCVCRARAPCVHVGHIWALWGLNGALIATDTLYTPSPSTPCSFLLRILTHKRFHSNLAIAPTCDTVSTDHITDNARDPQRGLSRATYLLKVSRRAAQPNEEES